MLDNSKRYGVGSPGCDGTSRHKAGQGGSKERGEALPLEDLTDQHTTPFEATAGLSEARKATSKVWPEIILDGVVRMGERHKRGYCPKDAGRCLASRPWNLKLETRNEATLHLP